jgi:hypothetical protein
MPLPQILCIGAQKAGTSWLHENLAKNPGIWVPPFKEMHFFDHKFVPANRGWTPWHVRKNIRLAKLRLEKNDRATPENIAFLSEILEPPILNGTWYKKVFSACPAGKVGLDVTPEYSSIPNEGIKFLQKFLGSEVRIIYIIRSPVERAMSQLAMNLSRQKNAPADRSEWLVAANNEAILDRGNYSSHVPRWDALVPSDQLLYLPYGRISQDPGGLLREIEAFIGLPEGTYPDAGKVIFKGRPVAIPDFVRAHYESSLSDQEGFIGERFGQEFAELTK